MLENFHAAQTFLLLQNPALNCNLLSAFPSKDFAAIRKLIVGLILATDLARSNEFLGQFKSWWAATEASDAVHVPGAPTTPKPRPVLQSTTIKDIEYEARVMTMKMALKCADIGHAAKRLSLHEKWTARITEEFYRQGDEERKMGLPISPFMDRQKANLSGSQLGFMDWIVFPLYGVWFKFLDPEEKRQREMWLEGRKREAAEAAAGEGAGGERGLVIGGGEANGSLVTVMEQLRKNREYWRMYESAGDSPKKMADKDGGREGRAQ